MQLAVGNPALCHWWLVTFMCPLTLQIANGRIQSLEATMEKLLASESKLKQVALTLELEREALLRTVEQLRGQAGD